MRVPQLKINLIIGHVCSFEIKIFLCKEITLQCLTPHRLLIWNMTRQVVRAQRFEPEVCFYCKYTNARPHLSLFMCVYGVWDTLVWQASHVNQGVDSGVSDPEIVAFTCPGTAKRSADITREGKLWPLLAALHFYFLWPAQKSQQHCLH